MGPQLDRYGCITGHGHAPRGQKAREQVRQIKSKQANGKKKQGSSTASFQGLSGAGLPTAGLIAAIKYHLLSAPDLRLVALIMFALVVVSIMARTAKSGELEPS